MYNSNKKARVLTFHHFNRKGWSLFSCLHREVRIGILAVATLTSATPRLMATSLRSAEGSEDVMIPTEADTLALGEASVSASRAPLAPGQAARQVITLSREDLAAAGVQSLNDVLKLSATTDVRQRGGFGIQTDISIAGGTHDQIAIFLNGVPLTNPQTGHNAADFPVNISDVERIEILEGAASRVLGCQAFSGAINIITRQPAKSTTPLEAQVEAGSYGTLRSEARTAWSLGKGWSLAASGSGQRSDGAVKNGDFKGGKGFAQICYDHSDFKLDVQAGASAQDFGANTFYAASYPNQWEATRRYLLSARAETRGKVHLIPQLSWVRSLDHFQLTRNSEKGENFHRTDVFTAGLNAWTDWVLGRTAAGAEVREDVIYSTNLGNPLAEEQWLPIAGEKGRYYKRHADRTNWSYFLEHNFIWRGFTLSLGVMTERNNAVDSKFRFYPGIDLAYRPNTSWRIYASWNKSLRLPTFTDLWYKSPTQEGNMGLRPEENNSVRIGTDFNHPIVNIQAKVHYQRGTNLIDWVMRSPDDIYHATAFSLDTYGAGLDAKINLSRWWGEKQPFESFQLSYAWLHQHRRKGEPYFKSNYAMEYLRHKLVGRLSHRIYKRLRADWTVRVQQREGAWLVYRDLKPTGELRPYGTHALLDCHIAWKAPRYEIYADLTNLTAHRYYDLANVRQPGFIVLAGLRFRL